MLYKYGMQTRDFWGVFILSSVYFSLFWGLFNKTIIPLALVGYEIGYSQLGSTGLVAYLPSRIQRTLVEELLNIYHASVKTLGHIFQFNAMFWRVVIKSILTI